MKISRLIIFLVAALLLWILYWVLCVKFIPASSDAFTLRGQFGDMFGAMNALFSAFAFAALIYTVFIQRQQLDDAKVAFLKSAEDQERAQAALANQLSSDHDLSRRKQSIELMQFYAAQMNQNAPAVYFARQLAEHLDEPQTAKAWKLEPFSVAEQHEQLIRGCLAGRMESVTLTAAHGSIPLTREQISVIRDLFGFYLNLLEVVSCAWLHHVGDRDILDSEFHFSVMPTSGNFPLDRLIHSSIYFPSLKAFVRHLKESSAKAGKQPTA